MLTDRLLTIDDDVAIGVFISKVAKSAGYEAVATTKADVFRERVAQWRPTVITMDLQMPGADGVELLRFLVAEKCEAQILLISGFDAKVLEGAQRLGVERGLTMSGTLSKPLRAEGLRNLLATLKQKGNLVDEVSLARAITNGELFLMYQPKVTLDTLRPIGLEALVRWQHPVRGLVPPSEFIPLAESSGLVNDLTEAVAELGLRQLQEWNSSFDGTLAINISGRNLHDLEFVDRLSDRCARLGVRTERLTLELTETNAMADPIRAMDILTRLRLKGFRLSIDDFGTGYSSLLQLARLPFSEMKVDQTFVKDMHRSAEARAIVKSSIDLAHNLSLRAVAEGVESAEVLRLLTDLGCDEAQGYHIARPMPPSDLARWLGDWETRRAAMPARDDASRAGMAVPPLASTTVSYDGSPQQRKQLADTLAGLLNPLWELGRNSLIGWRPSVGGIDVLMAPYQKIADCFQESRRMLRGRRLMGEGTFQTAQEIADIRPVHLPMRFTVADDRSDAVPTEDVELVLRRYGITETQFRAVGLFDIVGFSKRSPMHQVAQLNSLECSINTAQGIMHEQGRPIDLARTTTGDGFYIWNRDKGAQADLDTYLLTLLVLAENAMSRTDSRPEMVPYLRTCLSVGSHYSYHQVEGLDPHGHDYIVGDITIGLARMVSNCMPGQILIGDFTRPTDLTAEPGNSLEFVQQADGAFKRFDGVRLRGHAVTRVRCYLTGDQDGDGHFQATRFRIRDKHGFNHHVFNQKFNLYLAVAPSPLVRVDALYLGKQQSEIEGNLIVAVDGAS